MTAAKRAALRRQHRGGPRRLPAAPPTPAPSPEPAKAKKAASPSPQRRATETAGGALPASSSQVLVECAASAANVQSPKEFVEHWKATPEGGFKMTK